MRFALPPVIVLFLLCPGTLAEKPDGLLMCEPGKLLFSESFDSETFSDRWGIRAFFIVNDGVLFGAEETDGIVDQEITLDMIREMSGVDKCGAGGGTHALGCELGHLADFLAVRNFGGQRH